MDWYYVRDGEQIGPISESEFQLLVSTGAVTPSTVVWREGMGKWETYANAVGQPATPTQAQTQAPFGAAAAAGNYRCAECGNTFPASDMVQYGQSHVCAGCKNIFFQRIREGVSVGTALNYGGFWIRFGAKFIDGIVLQIVSLGINFGFGFLFSLGAESGGSVGLVFIPFLLQIGFQMWYTTWFLGKYAATPGKMATGLRVVAPDGGPISYKRAFGRYWAEMLSGLILGIGYLMAAWDDEKRTLHDRICDTRVIRA